MDVKKDKHFKMFVRSRNIQKSTANLYSILLNNYCEYFNKTLTEFIEEAEDEEEQLIRMKHRKIKEYLLEYNEMLEKTNFSKNYRNRLNVCIRSFYREFEIELPRPIPIRRDDDEILITTDNMLNKKHIKKALEFVHKKYAAIILVMMSSGMGASEVINLTFGDFLKSLEINENKVVNVGELDEILEKRNEYDLIPTWRIRQFQN